MQLGGVPSDDDISARIAHVLLPLARQQLDAVNRDHAAASTDAIAVVALDVALGSGLVVWADAHKYPDRWWVPLIGLVLSMFVAFSARVPLAPLDSVPHGFSRLRLRAWLRRRIEPGLVPDAGPDPVEMLEAVQSVDALDAYTLSLAALVQSGERSTASLDLKTFLLFVALLLLPLDAAASAVFFLR